MAGTTSNQHYHHHQQKLGDNELPTISPSPTYYSTGRSPISPTHEGEGMEVEADEQLKYSAAVGVEPADSSSSPSSCLCCTKSRIKHCIFLCLMLIILAVGLSVAFFDDPNPAIFFVQQDPPGQNETHPWATNGVGGLTLTIVNALDDHWTPYLEEEVLKWDMGTPDALTLEIVQEPVDPECSPSPGKLKVCNGDYGETGWRGLNINVLRNGKVVNSVAKMNEYYLAQARKAHWTYTMCHELGHGFGLPHTDEIYFNIDRGDCMDYTIRPFVNSRPGEFNFQLLSQLYGVVQPESGTSSVAISRPRPNDNDNNNRLLLRHDEKTKHVMAMQGDDDKEQEFETDETQRRLGSPEVEEEMPGTVMAKYQHLIDELGQQVVCARQRLCYFELQGAYTVEIHQLLVN